MDVSSPFDGPDDDATDALHGFESGTHVGAAEPLLASAPVHDPHDNLWIADGDRVWDLGPADVDSDADGIPDSLTRVGPGGVTVYTDTDHDGRVDAITEVHSDGAFESRRLDVETGDWVRTDIGRLD